MVDDSAGFFPENFRYPFGLSGRSVSAIHQEVRFTPATLARINKTLAVAHHACEQGVRVHNWSIYHDMLENFVPITFQRTAGFRSVPIEWLSSYVVSSSILCCLVCAQNRIYLTNPEVHWMAETLPATLWIYRGRAPSHPRWLPDALIPDYSSCSRVENVTYCLCAERRTRSTSSKARTVKRLASAGIIVFAVKSMVRSR